MNEPDRSDQNLDQSNLKCDDSDGFKAGWVRFEGAGGSVITTSKPPSNRCGTHASGYMSGAHPAVSDGVVERTVCFVFKDKPCVDPFSTLIRVRNCGTFYVYELPELKYCKFRFCTNPNGELIGSVVV